MTDGPNPRPGVNGLDYTVSIEWQQTDEPRETMEPHVGPADLRNSRLNANREVREIMRPWSGPSDLRYCKLNKSDDVRGQMRPRSRSNPSDLRYSRLQPDRDLRELMRPRPPRNTEPETVTEKLVNQLEESVDRKAEELESGLKTRETVIKRLKACIAEDEAKGEESYDSNVRRCPNSQPLKAPL